MTQGTECRLEDWPTKGSWGEKCFIQTWTRSKNGKETSEHKMHSKRNLRGSNLRNQEKRRSQSPNERRMRKDGIRGVTRQDCQRLVVTLQILCVILSTVEIRGLF